MEESRDAGPQELADIDGIRNLDTARMALRWALERLHKIEQEKAELADKLGQTDKTLRRAIDEQAALQKTISLRTSEADERELYYARLEEFLSLRLEGKLDPGELAKREIEVTQLREMLEQKHAQSERELIQRRGALEQEFKLRRRSKKTFARAKELTGRSGQEQAHSRSVSATPVRERELLLRQSALALRQAHFEVTLRSAPSCKPSRATATTSKVRCAFACWLNAP